MALVADPHAGKCSALVTEWRAKQNGEPRCQNLATHNGFCKRHQNQVSKTRGSQAIIKKYEKIGESKKISPVAAMTTLLNESAGNVEFFRNEVAKLQRLVIAGKKEREEVAKMVVLYNEERDRHERYVLDAIRVRLDEQQVRLYQSQAEVMAVVFKAVIDGIGLMGEQRLKALTIVAKQMELYSAKPESEWDGPLLEAEKLSNVRVVEGTVVEKQEAQG